MSKLPDGTVLPLESILSRRDFCRTAVVGGAALVTLGACGAGAPASPLDGGKKDLTQQLFPEEDMTGQPDMSTEPPDLAETPEDLSGDERDLARRDMANPNACPGGVTTTNMKPAAFQLNTATFVRLANAFVCRDGGGLFGVTAVCTHQGAIIGAVNGGMGGFRCPSHFSAFALDGSLVNGPALDPLSHHPLCIDGGGNVAVNANQTVAANKRYSF